MTTIHLRTALRSALGGALVATLLSGTAVAANPPVLSYLELSTLTPHQRVSIHGSNLDQAGQVHIAGIPAMVVPIQGTNAVKMNAYVPPDVPYGPCAVTVTTAAGTSNALTLNVVPRVPQGRALWRFFMNNQLMVRRPALGADGTIYAKSQAGDLIAITPYGEMKWLQQLGVALTPEVSVGGDGTIYTADGGPRIVAVNPDGSIKWTYHDSPNQTVLAGPNVGPDGNVYVVTHSPGSGAFSLTPSGTLRWKGPDNPYVPFGPKGQEIVFGNGQMYFCQDGYFDAFSFAGGHVLRKFTVTQNDSDSPQPAVGPGGDAYVEYWSQLKSYDPNGNENWTAFSPPGSYLRQPDVGADGTIYVMRNVFNTLHALRPDGSSKWSYSHPLTLINPVMSPNDDVMIIGGGEGFSKFFLAIDRDGNPRWQVDMPVEQLVPFETTIPQPLGRARFTPDGSVAYVMASSTPNSGGHCYLYAIQVGPIVDVGHALAGTIGEPSLVANGTLAPGSAFQLAMSGVKPGATVYLIAGTQAVGVPALGGVLVPSPTLVVPVPVGASGSFQASLTWPSSLPSGATIYVQGWIPDPAAPAGYAATNALSLITP